MDLHNCKTGKHDLASIFRTADPWGIETVVRWCVVCGCVVIDEEYDGRVSPGAHTKMQSAEIFKRG